ncbi:unnamed protein product [Trichogramma brassicae]|uniref:Uncharacterized protein n=1 Tax=Trichogramma brassicae TaxID=86971 RepID=A0A6H5IGI4_9HYME|nr:unnamed protein product [Trichogramma brassicae]
MLRSRYHDGGSSRMPARRTRSRETDATIEGPRPDDAFKDEESSSSEELSPEMEEDLGEIRLRLSQQTAVSTENHYCECQKSRRQQNNYPVYPHHPTCPRFERLSPEQLARLRQGPPTTLEELRRDINDDRPSPPKRAEKTYSHTPTLNVLLGLFAILLLLNCLHLCYGQNTSFPIPPQLKDSSSSSSSPKKTNAREALAPKSTSIVLARPSRSSPLSGKSERIVCCARL